MCARPFSLRNKVIGTFLTDCEKYCSERIQIDYIVHAQCYWLNKYGTGHDPNCRAQRRGEKNGKHLDQRNSNPSIYPFFLEIQHGSERLRVTCTVGCWPASTGKLRSWEDASWGCAGHIVICVDSVQETSFSVCRRETWVGAVHTGAHAFCAKIIARYEMRTYVWKLQMSLGLKKVRIKLQLCLKSSILICFWHSRVAF